MKCINFLSQIATSFTPFDVIKHKNDDMKSKSWLRINFLKVLGYRSDMECERDYHARWCYIQFFA